MEIEKLEGFRDLASKEFTEKLAKTHSWETIYWIDSFLLDLKEKLGDTLEFTMFETIDRSKRGYGYNIMEFRDKIANSLSSVIRLLTITEVIKQVFEDYGVINTIPIKDSNIYLVILQYET